MNIHFCRGLSRKTGSSLVEQMLINISNQPPKFQQFGIAGCALSLAALQQWAEGCSGRGKERKTLVYGQIQQIPSPVLLRVDQRVRASHSETHMRSLFKFQARKRPVPRNIIQGKIQKKGSWGAPPYQDGLHSWGWGTKSCPRGEGIPSEGPLPAPVPTDK